jgi:hypothetical protein
LVKKCDPLVGHTRVNARRLERDFEVIFEPIGVAHAVLRSHVMRTVLLVSFCVAGIGCADQTPWPIAPDPDPTVVLSISPAVGELGDAVVATESPPITFTVTNVSGESITPGGIGLSPDGSDIDSSFALIGDACSNVALEPGAQCEIDVALAPIRTGELDGVLLVNGATPDFTPSFAAMSSMIGKGTTTPGAMLSSTPSSLDLGQVVIGEATTHLDVTVTNSGTAPSFTLVAQLLGDPDFALYGDDCTNHSVLPGASCTVGVYLQPSQLGARSGTLELSGADGTFDVALTGTSVAQ